MARARFLPPTRFAPDPGDLPPFFVCKITASLGGGEYEWVEVLDQGTGTLTEKVGGRFGGPQNVGIDVLSAGFAVDGYALVRQANGQAGLTWELYAIGGAGGGAGGACAWVAGLSRADCLEARVIGASGACDCEDTDPTPARLTSDDGTTWGGTSGGGGGGGGVVTDCVPGVGLGDTASVAHLNAVVCGFFEFPPTLARVGPTGLWTATVGGETWTVECQSGSGTWALTITSGSGTVTGTFVTVVTGASDIEVRFTIPAVACTGGTAEFGFTIPKVADGGGGETPTGPTLTICGIPYVVAFNRGDCNGPCLTLTPPTASGGAVTAVRESCSGDSAVFAVGGAVCPGVKCGGPRRNLVRIQVRWVQCAWDGAGWYCVRDCETGETAAVELLDGAQYDDTISIISGPYATPEEALCAPGTTCADALPLDVGTFVFTSSTTTVQVFRVAGNVTPDDPYRIVGYGFTAASPITARGHLGGADFCYPSTAPETGTSFSFVQGTTYGGFTHYYAIVEPTLTPVDYTMTVTRS